MKLVLIGGGDYGVIPEKPYNLGHIDKEIFEMTGKPHPRILFIGFNERANFIFGCIKKVFMELGAMCEYLKFTELSNEKTVSSKLKRADAVYIGGGNPEEYMETLEGFGIVNKIKEAAERGAILVGMSAGAICYSKAGMSDVGQKDVRVYKYVEGMKLNDFVICPHFSNSQRKEQIADFMSGHKEDVSIGLDNLVALVIDGEDFRVLSADEKKAYSCFYDGENFKMEAIGNAGKLKDLLLAQ